MKLFSSLSLMLALAVSSPAFATVSLSSPLNGSTVGTTVHFSGSGSTTCRAGVAAMGIYVDNSLHFQINGASLNTTLPLSPGHHSVAVQEWDFCGGSTKDAIALNVSTKGAGVNVITPNNNSTVAPQAPFAATASSTCPSGVAAMGVYVDGALKAKQNGSAINTKVTLSSGTHQTVVQSWDRCGGSAKAPVTVKVSGSGNKMANLQAVGGWDQWGQLPPVYGICAPCNGVKWSMTQHMKANSLSGNATTFYLGGSHPYSDALFSIKLMGQGTKLGLPDSGRKLLPSIHHMTYDTDVFVSNMSAAQDLEFDVNMYLNGVGMEWGTECNHLNGNVWDIWNNVKAHWVHTSIPCTIKGNQWNHVSFTVTRQSNNDLTYDSFTVNGVTYNVNQTVAPFKVPAGWYGMTANYQMDGNVRQAAYTSMLDNFSITYW